MSKEISPQICVLHILDREEKTCIAINSRIHIWDTHWLIPVWYQLISCIIYPFMLCMVFFFLQSLILLQYARFCAQDQE